MKLLTRINLIREKSNPNEDCITAIKANANVIDALYRLSFTADKLTGNQIDFLVNQLKRRNDEIVVLLGRIVELKTNGFKPERFQNITSP